MVAARSPGSYRPVDEFALPAVVAAANATSSLVDGEEVTVDGTRGEVTRY
jgi:phosphohistidine swiveling domain-containing protein